MILETDPTKTRGICNIYPETKEERDILFALYEALNEFDHTCIDLAGIDDAIMFIIYRTDKKII